MIFLAMGRKARRLESSRPKSSRPKSSRPKSSLAQVEPANQCHLPVVFNGFAAVRCIG
jgi:hypothetical protein